MAFLHLKTFYYFFESFKLEKNLLFGKKSIYKSTIKKRNNDLIVNSILIISFSSYFVKSCWQQISNLFLIKLMVTHIGC